MRYLLRCVGEADDVLGDAYEDSTRFIKSAPPRTVALGLRIAF
jgi:hypothetical protein